MHLSTSSFSDSDPESASSIHPPSSFTSTEDTLLFKKESLSLKQTHSEEGSPMEIDTQVPLHSSVVSSSSSLSSSLSSSSSPSRELTSYNSPKRMLKNKLPKHTFQSVGSIQTKGNVNSQRRSSLNSNSPRKLSTNQEVSSSGSPRSPYSKKAPLDSTIQFDWDFWGLFLQDYHSIASTDPDRIKANVHRGIPDALRGDIWLLLAQAKNEHLESKYFDLLEYVSPFEKQIQRDLLRTFPKHPFFRKGGQGVKALFNLTKAYSLFDIEVGYCQGLSFVAGLILLNVHNEAEAFSLFVKLLKSYGLRELYTPTLEGLQLFMFQLDQLMHMRMPDLYLHLTNKGIHPSMYAPEWFMTLFSCRFPLKSVFRILDLIFTEGVNIILKIALVLLSKSQPHLLQFEFDDLLAYLKFGMFKDYESMASTLIDTALSMELTNMELDSIASKFNDTPTVTEATKLDEVELLRFENRQLTQHVHQLELEVKELKLEHRDFSNALMKTKLDLANAQESHSIALRQLALLQRRKSSQPHPSSSSSSSVSSTSSSRNSDMAAMYELNNILTLQLQELQNELINTKSSLSQALSQCEELRCELAAKNSLPPLELSEKCKE